MTAFSAIEQSARERLGGGDALESRLIRPEPAESLAMIGDDRYLSVMCRRIFRAGLTHRLVDARWPAFEIAFDDFDPAAVAALDDDDLKRLAADETLIRHRRKIFAVRNNAVAMQAIIAEFGSFGFWLAEWPEDEIVDLWHELRQRFTQLGGRSGPAFLRMAGKDTFMLTDWVVKAMAQWQAYSGKSHTRNAHAEIQALFNGWQAESDRPLCQISQILAFSID
ncbi:DNA-3-methyladenine glycosylase I [Salinisphaera orenii]|uniref:3-methyladenine DNA glycosylase n=1 Tax=Salinisphaera orenii YIM 95161 TaxID=1051139 RepID=A0A423PDY6_9GAMM|nr:DNA-3-methyladenine glycosylase I [Salinisphaera halophila]ROO23861.1 3-methyladenine DNA glycosylase [Salinisphaera halophila YIM 95161]